MTHILTSKEEIARSKVCLALDVPSIENVNYLVSSLHDLVGLYKIGKELFTAAGPAAVQAVHDNGGRVFLDLKYHDIPNTVRGAARNATKLGVSMFNVHAPGGQDMMEAAMVGVEDAIIEAQQNSIELERPKVLGVTVLTSLDDKILKEQLGIQESVKERVIRLSKLTYDAGLDGVVCSASDLDFLVRPMYIYGGKNFMYVTPGIKGPRSMAGADQKRVNTPGLTLQNGSTILVIGRAIRDPFRAGYADKQQMRTAAYEILQDMAEYL